jgi:hypothetical protein
VRAAIAPRRLTADGDDPVEGESIQNQKQRPETEAANTRMQMTEALRGARSPSS